MVASTALLRVNIRAPPRTARSTKKRERTTVPLTGSSRTPARPRGVALAASLPPARRGPRPPSAVRDRTAGPETRSRSRRRERGRGGVSVPGNCRQGGASRLLTALFLWSDWLSCTRTCICTCSTSPGLALRGSKEQPHACSCKPVMQLFLERVFQEHVTRIREVGSSNPRVVAVQYAHP